MSLARSARPLLRASCALLRATPCTQKMLSTSSHRALSVAARSSWNVRASGVLPKTVAQPLRPAARAPQVNMLRAYATGTATPLLASRPIVAYHLLASAALVFLIIIVGGITRLTESGLSITEWNPGLKGMRLPWTDDEWHAEWNKYKQSPEFTMYVARLTQDQPKHDARGL